MTADKIVEIIIDRRNLLIDRAKKITSGWFCSDTIYPKQRYYVPMVRARETKSGGKTVSIYWARRTPVNKWRGKIMRRGKGGPSRLTKVTNTYMPANKVGQAYPISMFTSIDENCEERQDILVVEKKLSAIRAELKALGRLIVAAKRCSKHTISDLRTIYE